MIQTMQRKIVDVGVENIFKFYNNKNKNIYIIFLYTHPCRVLYDDII